MLNNASPIAHLHAAGEGTPGDNSWKDLITTTAEETCSTLMPMARSLKATVISPCMFLGNRTRRAPRGIMVGTMKVQVYRGVVPMLARLIDAIMEWQEEVRLTGREQFRVATHRVRGGLCSCSPVQLRDKTEIFQGHLSGSYSASKSRISTE